YYATVRGLPGEDVLERAQRGIRVDGEGLRLDQVEVIARFPHRAESKRRTRLRVTLRGGRNREIRRVLSVLGHPVLELHRTRIGCLADTGLTPGSWRKLQSDEVEELRELIRRCAGEIAAPARTADSGPPAPPARPAPAAFVVAIDGPAGSGKTSVARAVAERFGFGYFNTGASVRAVALSAMRQDLDLDDGPSLRTLAYRVILDPEGRVFLDGEDVSGAVRTPEVSAGASRVAVHPELREVLVERWRQFAAAGGVVEGRDIGTVVFPEAPVKVFLDARPEVRARRRSSDEGDRDVGAVQSEISSRDHTDSGRAVAPLRRAEDAHRLDTSDLTLGETVDRVAALVEAARSRDRT
ncbi:MAG: (d)CMP kinase, partial [Acidobacteria bacterium]|nr:(d)CMP kinase [Acidobacteriota bacterium]